MTPRPDHTHALDARTWVPSAEGHPDFPVQNLPLGVFRERGSHTPGRVGVAIGDEILDVAKCLDLDLVEDPTFSLLRRITGTTLNGFCALSAAERRAVRHALFALLVPGSPAEEEHRRRNPVLVPQRDADLLLPCRVGDYTDFYASIHHATNVGRMFRPDNPLLPNYHWVPIGYHGRASTITVSGAPVRRPVGQLPPAGGTPPVVGPSQRLDYEAELGLWVGPGNRRGTPIPITEAGDHLVGLSLLNDWSARDVQSWEYQPLGPFLSKNFGTSLSPWLVTAEALAPFRAPLAAREAGLPAPLPYLHDIHDAEDGALDVTVEAWLLTPFMRSRGHPPVRLSRASARLLYWTPAQLITHHTMNGCALAAGDLLGTGTISGPERDQRGCLLELGSRGQEPVTLPDGETRSFLEDGDELTLTGYAEREGRVRIGLGTCRAVVEPAA